MCCSTRAVTDIVESNHLAAPSCQKYVNVCFANCHKLTADWPCKAKLFAPAHTKCEKCLSGFSQRAVSRCFAAPFCYRCVLKACPLPASLGPIMSNRRYLHEAMTAEDVSKLFDSLCDTVVSALAKRDAEIEYSAASSFDPLQLILDFQSLQKDVREWKEDARESHATRELPVARSEAPPKFKQLEKQPRPNCSSRSLARAALQAVCGMVAQHTATEAQRPCPHRGGNSNVTSRGTAHAVQQNGSARDPAVRISGKDHTTQDETTQVSSGKVSVSPSSRNAAQGQMACFCDLRARRAGSFQQADQAFSANKCSPKLLKVMDGQKTPGPGGGPQNKAQGLSGHGRKRSRNGVGGVGTIIRAAPEAGFWVALRKCATTLLLLCFSGCYHIFPALRPFSQVWKTSVVETASPQNDSI